MAANVVPISRLFQRSWDWSPREIAEFYRVEAALLQAGLRIDTARGLSDDGDPWFVFCRHDDGEVIIHIARIDGEYVLVSPCYDGIARGRDISSMVRDLVSRHPLVHVPQSKSKPGSNVFLHPAVLLIAVVATAFFKQSEARAATADSDGGDAANPRSMLALGTSQLALKGAAQVSVTMDAAQSAVILSAIAAGLQAAPAVGDELATVAAPERPAWIEDSASPASLREHDTQATVLPLSAADSADAHDHGGTALQMPGLPTPEGVNALPLVAVLWDLLHQPAETNPTGHWAPSAQDGANPVPSSAVPTHAVLSLNVGQTENSSGSLPTVQSAKISVSSPDNTVQSHDVQHLDQLPANLTSALQGAAHSPVNGTIDIGSSSSFADALITAVTSSPVKLLASSDGTISLPGSIGRPPDDATGHPNPVPSHAAAGGSPPDTASHPVAADASATGVSVNTADHSINQSNANVSPPDLQAIMQAFLAATPAYEIAETGHQVIIFDPNAMATDQGAVKTVSFDFADGSTLSLIGLPMALPNPHIA
jgi:hypothetical protein